MLTGAGGHSSKRNLIERVTVSGQVPFSGARRRDKELDVVSTVNGLFWMMGQIFD